MAFTPKGDAPLWQAIYDEAVLLEPGDVIGFDRLAVLLGYDPQPAGASRTPIHTASRRLLKDHDRTLLSVRGKGYKVAHASEHEGIARQKQRSGRRQIRRAHTVATHVDRNALTVDQRTSLDAFAHILAQQNSMLKRHDKRLTAVESSSTTHDARLDVLEQVLRTHGIEVPKSQTVEGETV